MWIAYNSLDTFQILISLIKQSNICNQNSIFTDSSESYFLQ